MTKKIVSGLSLRKVIVLLLLNVICFSVFAERCVGKTIPHCERIRGKYAASACDKHYMSLNEGLFQCGWDEKAKKCVMQETGCEVMRKCSGKPTFDCLSIIGTNAKSDCEKAFITEPDLTTRFSFQCEWDGTICVETITECAY